MMWEPHSYASFVGATGQRGTGHSKRLRTILKEARERLDLSAREVAERIAAHLRDVGDTDATPPSVNTIYSWEKFERHPSISNFAAWARVLGYRLIVELDAADSKRHPILVRTEEAAEAARRIDRLDEKQREAVLLLIRSMSAHIRDD